MALTLASFLCGGQPRDARMTTCSPWTRAPQLIRWVAKFCEPSAMSALARTSALCYESIDDTVWEELCSCRIQTLPVVFHCFQHYFRAVIRGESLSSDAVFMSPVNKMINTKGSTASSTMIAPTNAPAVQLLRSSCVDMILLDRPEMCFVGFTCDPTLRSAKACWSEVHRVYPLAFTTPGTTIRLTLRDVPRAESGKTVDEVVFTVMNLAVDADAPPHVMEQHTVALGRPVLAADLKFMVVMWADRAKVSIL
jgi:hypothetical protein